MASRKPIDIAHLIFVIHLRKKWNIEKVLINDVWISKIDMNALLSMEHLHQYVTLWTFIRQVGLIDVVMDYITSTLTENGQYSTKSAYNA
jgi:hypothetical protein